MFYIVTVTHSQVTIILIICKQKLYRFNAGTAKNFLNYKCKLAKNPKFELCECPFLFIHTIR